MPEPEKPLDSWKEIAAYFDRTVRTVQNWEKQRGLPVHRFGSRVQAFPQELDEWQRQQVRTTTPFLARRSLRVVLFSVPVVTGIAWLAFQPVDGPATEQSAFRVVTVLEDQDRLRITPTDFLGIQWEILTPDLDTNYYGTLTSAGMGPGNVAQDYPVLIRQLPQETSPRLWFIARHVHPIGTDQLRCYSAEGELLWEQPVGRSIVEPPPRGLVFDSYSGSILGLVEIEGAQRLLVLETETNLYASRLTLRDPLTGLVAEEAWHPGRVASFRLADLDGDDLDELVLGGTNNPGPGPGHSALWVMKLPFSAAGTVEADFFGNRDAPRTWRYRLFAAPDVLLTGGAATYARNIEVRGKQRRLEVELGVMPYRMFHVLDFETNPVTAYPSDMLKEWHRQQVKDGTLHHHLDKRELELWRRSMAFDEVPNGNDPAIYEQLDGFVDGDWQEGLR